MTLEGHRIDFKVALFGYATIGLWIVLDWLAVSNVLPYVDGFIKAGISFGIFILVFVMDGVWRWWRGTPN